MAGPIKDKDPVCTRRADPTCYFAKAPKGGKWEPTALPVVIAEKGLMLQLLQNLMTNAMKYVEQGKSPQVHVGARRGEGEWLMWVKDNGIGITPENREKVFGMFNRLHTRQEYPGTGIGLAICRRIVDYHGGRIWVESSPGEGSTFYFTIPDRERSPAQQAGG